MATRATTRVWEGRKDGSGNQDGWTKVVRGKHQRSYGRQDSGLARGKDHQQRVANRVNPNFDAIDRVTTSIFVSNIPWKATAKDIWEECNKWGTVIDVFIPAKLSKSGVRFGFVKFIRVRDVVGLISNLRTIWLGAFHLFADLVRFPRGIVKTSGRNPPVPKDGKNLSNLKGNNVNGMSYADALNLKNQENNKDPTKLQNSSPLDDTSSSKTNAATCCNKVIKSVELKDEDLLDLDANRVKSSILVKVTDIQVIDQIPSFLKLNGFDDFAVKYMGGKWVWLELASPQAVNSLKNSSELAKMVSTFANVEDNFVLDERVVWLDMFGAPLVAWSVAAFKKLGAIWGDVVMVERDDDDALGHGKVCVITKCMNKIQETLSITAKKAKYMVNVSEFAHWIPEMTSQSEDSFEPGDESDGKSDNMSNETLDFQEEKENQPNNSGGDGTGSNKMGNEFVNKEGEGQSNSDPFNLEDIIKRTRKKTNDVENSTNMGEGFIISEPKEANLNDNKIEVDSGEPVNSKSSTSLPPGFFEYASEVKRIKKSGNMSNNNQQPAKSLTSLCSRQSRYSSDEKERLCELGKIMGLEMPENFEDGNRLVFKNRVNLVVQ